MLSLTRARCDRTAPFDFNAASDARALPPRSMPDGVGPGVVTSPGLSAAAGSGGTAFPLTAGAAVGTSASSPPNKSEELN